MSGSSLGVLCHCAGCRILLQEYYTTPFGFLGAEKKEERSAKCLTIDDRGQGQGEARSQGQGNAKYL